MMSLSLTEIAGMCGGALIQGVPSHAVNEVSTDTRAQRGGELFVALAGENFDAHDFLGEASGKGAAALLVSKLTAGTESTDAAIIHVRDTLKSLQDLARRYRKTLNLKAVGITGSNGKTSTKDFIASVLAQQAPVNATRGNLNNHIGLPLTILRTGAEHRFGVWEMGMSNPGEIELLAEIAAPDAAVITNIGTAHIEFMKSRDAIACEKGMLAEAVGPEGCVILNAADDCTPGIASRCRAKVVTAGIECGEVQAENLAATPAGSEFDIVSGAGRVRAVIPVPGRHMVGNALLAAALGIEWGLTLEQVANGLAAVELTGGRLQRRLAGGFTFLDDSYNANPDSMRAAIATLESLDVAGRRVAVLGKMAELGEHAAREHRALGETVAGSRVALLVVVGEEARGIADGARSAGGDAAVEWFPTHAEAAEYLKGRLKREDLVLVKGSRSAGMEKVIQEISD